MDITRKLGILVFFGVPAIIGGGVVYHFFGDYNPVIIYEIILALFAGGIVSR
jgi:zinc transporter ZupT